MMCPVTIKAYRRKNPVFSFSGPVLKKTLRSKLALTGRSPGLRSAVPEGLDGERDDLSGFPNQLGIR
jgi:hypothetical protein